MSHLRGFPERTKLLAALKIEKSNAQILVDELITAANRLDIPRMIENSLLSRNNNAIKREQMAMRQVLRVQTILRDFIAWFAYLEMDENSRPLGLTDLKDHLFTSLSSLDQDDLPSLSKDAVDLNKRFVGHWLSALMTVTVENAGHSAGREISIEQNEALGKVITSFDHKATLNAI